MANIYTNLPLTLDTDFVSFRTVSGYANGIRPAKIVLIVSAATATAGTVTITSPNNSSQSLYFPIAVGTQTQNTVILNDNVESCRMNWADFSVTGLTATGTKLYIWYNS